MANTAENPTRKIAEPAISKPNLVSIETGTAQGTTTPSRSSNRALWLVAALGLCVAAYAWYQASQLDAAHTHIAALSSEVSGLESELAAAETQIATYETQRGLVKGAVADISARMGELAALVGLPSAIETAAPDEARVETTPATDVSAPATEAIETF